jgi:MFS family permease
MSEPQAASGSKGAPGGWTVKSAYALAVLTVIYTLNYADRQVLGLVLPLIKRDMHLSDVSLGLITGFAFVLFYTLVGVPIARLADRANRRNILLAGLTLWSLMTALTGAVTSVPQLAATRFLMGAGEAAGVAPSSSIVADLFDKARRPLAMAILTSGSALAALIFFPLIGWIAQTHGWRTCFYFAGSWGLVMAVLLITTVAEPQRAGLARGAKVAQESLGATARFLLSSRSYVLTVAGGAFVGISLYAGQVWHPSFLARVHHLNMVQIGASVGVVRGIAGLSGTLLGGLLADRLGRRDDRWRLWVPGIACMVVLPAELLFLLSPSLPVAFVGMALVHLCLGMHFGPVYAICQNIAKPTMRATATATFLLAANLFGQIIGPLAVGYLNDRWAIHYGQEAIRYSLILGGVCAAIGGLLFLAGARTLARDTTRAET